MDNLSLTNLTPGMYHWDDTINENNQKICEAFNNINITDDGNTGKFYTTLEEIGLSDDSFTDDDFMENMLLLVNTIGPKSQMYLYYISVSASKFAAAMHNFLKEKLMYDSLRSNDGGMIIHTGNSINLPTLVQIMYNTSDEVIQFSFDPIGGKISENSLYVLSKQALQPRTNLLIDSDLLLPHATKSWSITNTSDRIRGVWATYMKGGHVDLSLVEDDNGNKFKVVADSENEYFQVATVTNHAFNTGDVLTASARVNSNSPCSARIMITNSTGTVFASVFFEIGENDINKDINLYITTELTSRPVNNLLFVEVRLYGLNGTAYLDRYKLEYGAFVTPIPKVDLIYEKTREMAFYQTGRIPNTPLFCDKNQILLHIPLSVPMVKVNPSVKILQDAYAHKIDDVFLFKSAGDIIAPSVDHSTNQFLSYWQELTPDGETDIVVSGDIITINTSKIANNGLSEPVKYEIRAY